MNHIQPNPSTQNGVQQNWVEVMVAAPLPRLFTYKWAFASRPKLGMRVIVPWGNGLRVGLVYGQTSVCEAVSKIKTVEEVLDSGELLDSSWFELMTFCANYYHYPLGMICLEALPKAMRKLAANGNEPVMVKRAHQKVESITRPEPTAKISPAPFGLAPEQADAVSAVRGQAGFLPYLLHGVTGSGKTEVYIQLIADCLAKGRQALVLLPEINLTPSALAQYESRLAPFVVRVLHSRLTESQRTQNWLACANGMADVLIATRLGVLTPMPRLGLVIVDEEHDPSYKQQEGMKYNARDVAVMRAKLESLIVVLGSATPSLETWYRAEKGHYKLLTLAKRAVTEAKLPNVEVIDTQKHKPIEGLTEPVVAAIRETLSLGLQCLVFLNRRGYAPQMTCDACGWVADCMHCSAHMVWHKRDHNLRCHHCGAGQRLPRHCPQCGNQDLHGFGHGTQRIEETLQGLFPHKALVRIDADTTRNKGQMESLLQEAHSGEASILVGTQMIAKGHDFAHIALVVALNADSSLYSHAYRAPERLFAQLMQVAGRGGRHGLDARMLIQTRYPDHPLFAALKSHDFAAFASQELSARREARMPPFSYQATLRADHKKLENCLIFLNEAKAMALSLGEQNAVFLCDPVPLSLFKVAGVERAQLLIESESRPALQQFLSSWLELLYAHKTPVRWFVEVDPSEL